MCSQAGSGCPEWIDKLLAANIATEELIVTIIMS